MKDVRTYEDYFSPLQARREDAGDHPGAGEEVVDEEDGVEQTGGVRRVVAESYVPFQSFA